MLSFEPAHSARLWNSIADRPVRKPELTKADEQIDQDYGNYVD